MTVCLLLIRAQPSVSVLLLVYLSDYPVYVSAQLFFFFLFCFFKEINLISTMYYIVKLYSKWSLYL